MHSIRNKIAQVQRKNEELESESTSFLKVIHSNTNAIEELQKKVMKLKQDKRDDKSYAKHLEEK